MNVRMDYVGVTLQDGGYIPTPRLRKFVRNYWGREKLSDFSEYPPDYEYSDYFECLNIMTLITSYNMYYVNLCCTYATRPQPLV